MNTTDQLLADLRAAGFRLEVRGDRLDVSPGSSLTLEQTAAIKANRDALFERVRADSLAASVGTPHGPKARGTTAWLWSPDGSAGPGPTAAAGSP